MSSATSIMSVAHGARAGVGVATAQSEIAAKVIATGGLAVLFDKATDIFDAVDADLTLEGLAILAERAVKK